MIISIWLRKENLGCVQYVLGNKSFLIDFKYGQDKWMSTEQLITILGDKEEEIKGKEEIIFPTKYHTWV